MTDLEKRLYEQVLVLRCQTGDETAFAELGHGPRRGRPGEAVKKDLEKLAGTWQHISAEKDGRRVPEGRVKRHTLVITGDRYEVRMDGKTIEEGTVSIDPSRKPKAIDAYPRKPEGKVLKGIYEIGEDDTIRACFAHPAATRRDPPSSPR
jgi:uncharacterized protein (TIGR03067 family)